MLLLLNTVPEASIKGQERAARWERIETGLKCLNPNFQVKKDVSHGGLGISSYQQSSLMRMIPFEEP